MANSTDPSLQAAIRAKGETIFNLMENEGKSIFNKDWWYGQIMEWSMKNERFKTQMFRFVDVLPTLNSGSEVARHLKEYFAEDGQEMPKVFGFGLGLGSLAPGLMAKAVRNNVEQMAKMFITGETPQEALPVLKKSRQNKIGFTVDLLGEACLSEREAADYQKRYLELINWLSKDAASWEHVPQIDEDHRGPIPKVNVSVKLSSLYSQIDVKDWEASKEKCKERLRPVFRLAIERGVFLNLDMEQYELKELTLDVFTELLMEPEFRSYAHFGCVIQAYLRDAFADCQKLITFAKQRGQPFTVRLVKGAYWDFETVHSAQMNWPVPVFTNKKESDACFEDCAVLLLKNVDVIRLALGSHNVRSIAAVMVQAERMGLDPRSFEIQMLFGMADPIKRSLVKMGFRVREYAPVGELLPGMAYLVRRLLENTSNESFLRSKFADGVSSEALLADPRESLSATPTTNQQPSLTNKFINESNLDFGLSSARQDMLKALESVKRDWLGKDHAMFIGGREVKTTRWLERHNPSHPSQLIGRVCIASEAEGEAAIESASRAFTSWKKTSAEERAHYLDRLADVLLRDRNLLAALEVFEVGKPWEEADGDITEAIDFCRYYARHMRQLAKPQRVGHAPGEVSLYHYQPRGVSVVIAPWNFPLAILTGMVAASIVTGNTCVFKPAEQSPIIGAYLMRALREIKLPDGVANCLQGYGEEIGEFLTGHIKTNLICFTGSKAVGLHICQKAAMTAPGQLSVKRTIIEMGGKNAVIVDTDADLDEAVTGVVYSAFGFAGQKCSAASRVIVLNDVYDRFVDRLIEATRSITVGFAEHPATYMGPVVDQESKERICATIEAAKKEAKLAYQGSVPSEGHFVGPTIFTDVAANSKLAQQEIFGPVLAVIRVADMDEAIHVANSVEYGLTGGLYSRSPAHIARAKAELEVGNLYINRGITGAMVDRHPFGGFKMSGVGSKTGGPDYLLQFMEPRVITENTLRRGFAPQEEA